MTTVLVLAPMRAELTPLVKRLDLHRDERADGRPTTWSGRCGAFDVVATMAGVGTSRAAAIAETLIDLARPDHVVVAGVAGGLAPDLVVGDLVVPATVRSLDTGTSHRAHRFGDQEPAGELLTSTVMYGWDVLEEHSRAGSLAIDMETAAIAEACERSTVPWTAFRALSDVVREGTVDASTLAFLNEDGSTNLGGVAKYLARHPGRVRGLAAMGRDSARATSAVADAVHAALLSASA